MPAIYFDLDGTLIDVRRRHYAAYADTLSALGLAAVDEPAYWGRRRRGASSMALLNGADEPTRARFLDGWIARVESEAYLALDGLIPGALEAIDALRETHALALVTLRRDRAALLGQLRHLDLYTRFDAVLSPAGHGESKTELIRGAGVPASDSLVVGDSEADVETAHELGLASVCVTAGVRERAFLRELAPDLLIESVVDLPGVCAGLVPAG